MGKLVGLFTYAFASISLVGLLPCTFESISEPVCTDTEDWFSTLYIVFVLTESECKGFLCYSGRCLPDSIRQDFVSDCPGMSFEDEHEAGKGELSVSPTTFENTHSWVLPALT